MAKKTENGTTNFPSLRQAFKRWLGGVGCRVSFYMVSALVLVTLLTGALLFWENRKALDAEVRGRALMLARVLSALTTEDIITGNKHAIYKKIEAHFSHDNGLSDRDLSYLMVYDRGGDLLVGSNRSAVFFGSGVYFYTLPSGQNAVIEDVSLGARARSATIPVFENRSNGIYDLLVPIMADQERVGFVRVGILKVEMANKSTALLRQGAIGLLGVLFVGMAFSQIITIGITKPIRKISQAVEQVGQQDWDVPPPMTGKDEISKLAQAFHHMMTTLQQREQNISNWNRDLFLLHTAGLDLMESLELEALVLRILSRMEDLVRAEFVALSLVDAKDGMLRYHGVSGARARILEDLETPFESAGVYNWMASYGTPLLIADARTDFRMNGEQMARLGIKGLMVVPIWLSNSLRGLLTAINKKGGAAFDKHDLRLLTVFSSLAGAALQNASLYTDLKRSIEELKSTQEQLVHSSKMAAIGELSANIAHEINNPLTSVLGYTSHLIKTLALPDESRRTLLLMEQETLRMRKIIRNLLDFSRQKPSWLRPSDVSLPLKESLALLQGMAESASIRIIEDYPVHPVIVKLDHNDIKQVFINILYNALQAMPSGGELRVRLLLQNDTAAVVEIEDTGIGIPEENISKIFEPFFSTKESGHGTGLGLSISYRIVQNHAGKITVRSSVGKGTAFRLEFPLCSEGETVRRFEHINQGRAG